MGASTFQTWDNIGQVMVRDRAVVRGQVVLQGHRRLVLRGLEALQGLQGLPSLVVRGREVPVYHDFL